MGLPPVRGAFEAHLTVDTARSAEFEALCGELGVDHVGIELAEGVHRAQPMTASHHRGDLADVMAEVEALRARLVAAGFTVVRTKLEAAVDNAGIPTADGYFEFHVKVAVDEIGELGERAARHGGRLSRSERRPGQRFVTLRVHGDRTEAEARLAALLAGLSGFDVRGVVREYTVFDSRIQLDAGWLEPA